MSDEALTQEELEKAVEQAMNNFGSPNTIILPHNPFMYSARSGVAPDITHTVSVIMERYAGMAFWSAAITQQDYNTMGDAARAFHNIGLDPRPDKT